MISDSDDFISAPPTSPSFDEQQSPPAEPGIKTPQGWTTINEPVRMQPEQETTTAPDIELPNSIANDQSVMLGDETTTVPSAAEIPAADSAAPTTPPKPAKTKKGKLKYFDYPESATDEEMIAGDPDLLVKANIFRLAKSYSAGELAKLILAKHPNSGMTQPIISNRIVRGKDHVAERDGRTREEVTAEIEEAKKAKGILANGKRKAVGEEGSQETGKKAKVVLEMGEGAESKSTVDSGVAGLGEDESAARFRALVPGAEEKESLMAKALIVKEAEERGAGEEEKEAFAKPVHLGTFRSW